MPESKAMGGVFDPIDRKNVAKTGKDQANNHVPKRGFGNLKQFRA